MNSIKLMTTVQTPSRFGMPACGHAFETAHRGSDVAAITGFGTSVVERDRFATQIKGGLGLVPAYVPGISAWSPPTS